MDLSSYISFSVFIFVCEHLVSIAKATSSTFTCSSNNYAEIVGQIGRPGKKGPPGQKGEPGRKAGEDIYDRIADIERKYDILSEELIKARETLQHYEEELKNFKDQHRGISNQVKEEEMYETPVQNPAIDEIVCPRKNEGKPSGVYRIQRSTLPAGIQVYCDTATDGGGWIVIQKRINGIVDFERSWNDYLNGFGNNTDDYWLGLDYIQRLTSVGNWELRIDLSDWDNEKKHAKYTLFRVGSKESNYQLDVGGYSGDAGDAMTFNNKQMFSTADVDNDQWEGGSCAKTHRGGWWYYICTKANLNGIYFPHGKYEEIVPVGIVWQEWKGFKYSLKTTEMKIRPHT